jgi:hypothetical protein
MNVPFLYEACSATTVAVSAERLPWGVGEAVCQGEPGGVVEDAVEDLCACVSGVVGDGIGCKELCM